MTANGRGASPCAGAHSDRFRCPGRHGQDILRRRIHRLALAGHLRVSEARAIALMHAVGTGTVLTLYQQPGDRRDPGLPVAAREAVIAA